MAAAFDFSSDFSTKRYFIIPLCARQIKHEFPVVLQVSGKSVSFSSRSLQALLHIAFLKRGPFLSVTSLLPSQGGRSSPGFDARHSRLSGHGIAGGYDSHIFRLCCPPVLQDFRSFLAIHCADCLKMVKIFSHWRKNSQLHFQNSSAIIASIKTDVRSVRISVQMGGKEYEKNPSSPFDQIGRAHV